MAGGRLGNVPILLQQSDVYLASCRRQLRLLHDDAARTITLIQDQFAAAPAGSLARRRAEAMIEAVRGQADDISRVLAPLLSDEAAESAQDSLPREFPPLLQHVHQLFRDWGWVPAAGDENDQVMRLVEAVLGDTATGRMIVLGAGGSRLAYDLHRRDAANDTIAVDVDPLLVTVADIVTRGGEVGIREANAEIDELDRASHAWTLRAPHGPIDRNRFEIVIANALRPPFPDGSFDTVLTPWFIDVVPPDAQAFLPVVRRLLKPGGRWLNVGPLRYLPQTALPQRYSREELFALAAEAGFTVTSWRTASIPYLVSKSSQRGKVEWVAAWNMAV